MKIGTLTTHMADNYGAVLQAYALSTYLGQQPDCDCEVIHYFPDYLEAVYCKRPKIDGPKNLVNFIYQTIFAGKRKERSARIEVFRKTCMRRSPEYRTREELTEASANYDAIVAGSDQIWNPSIHGFDENFFLTFCKEGVIKNGYAPSFGESHLTAEQAAEVKRRCTGFNRLAFREESGVRIAKEALGLDCPLVLDPVFLLSAEHWRSLKSGAAPKKKYVLCYFLSNPRGSVRAMCKRFKKQGYKVYSIGFSSLDVLNTAKKLYNLSPTDFLDYIDNADYILTDSFHATAFSVMFEKNFYTRTDGINAKRADRVVTLLKAAGLTDRTYADAQAGTLPFTPVEGAVDTASLAAAVQVSREYANAIVDDCRN